MKEGDNVRIARACANQFQAAAMKRVGTVRRVRDDGMLVIKWDGLSSDQVYHPSRLELAE